MPNRPPISRHHSLAVAFVLLAFAAPPVAAQPMLHEDGFRVRVYDHCAEDLSFQQNIIVDAICSPGGEFGEFIYYSFTSTNLDRRGVNRFSFSGRDLGFTGIEGWVPGFLAFSPPDGIWGEFLTVVDLLADPGPDWVAPDGGHRLVFTMLRPGPMDFDRSGRFGRAMYVACCNYAGRIYKIDELDDLGFGPHDPPDPSALFTPVGPVGGDQIRFGPGGVWGTDLYVAGGAIVDPNGTSRPFPFPIREFDWSDGPGWNGDMFDRCGPYEVCRVRPDGRATLFASNIVGELVFCGGDLWMMKAESCTRIRARKGRAETTISPSSVGLRSSGRDFSIHTSIVDADTGEPLDPSLLGPAWISQVILQSSGAVVLPVPSAEPGCDTATEDGIWETLEDRVVQGAGSVTLRFNTPSDGLCETRDGDRQDLIALLLEVPDGETAKICFQALTPELASPVEGCGEVTVLNRGNR